MVTPAGRILIVDDTPDNVWVLAYALKGLHTISVALNGQRAMQLAQTEPQPDLILLDIQMPEMDGYAVCSALKESPSTKNIPIIFVTSERGAGSEARGLAMGAVDYIHKPFEPAIVRARVRTHLEIKYHRDHLDRLVKARTHSLLCIQNTTIQAMATMAEWRDPETGAHIHRTQEYVRCLAGYLSQLPRYKDLLTTEFIDLLYQSAPLHDIGKISISDAILFKAGELTPEEYNIMKQHTTFGAAVLRDAEKNVEGASFLHVAREIAHYHHEQWSGAGYPEGLQGEEIPLCARIMALADVYDALTSKRVYKETIPHEHAVRIIIENMEGYFDPDIVRVFLRIQDSFEVIAQRINAV